MFGLFKNSNNIKIDEKKVSSGIMDKEFYKNGKVMIQYIDGEFDRDFMYTGKVKEFYSNGDEKFIGKYKDGKMWQGFLFTKKLKNRESIAKEIRNGNIFIPDSFYPEKEGEEYDFYDRLIFKGQYEDKEYANGSLYVYDKQTGALIENFKGFFKNGRKSQGTEKVFDKESGEIIYEFDGEYDEQNGEIIKKTGTYFSCENGKKSKGTNVLNNNLFFLGEKDAYGDEFNGQEFSLETRKLVFEGKYKKDINNNYSREKGKEFHEDGSIKFEGNYLNGKRTSGAEYEKGKKRPGEEKKVKNKSRTIISYNEDGEIEKCAIQNDEGENLFSGSFRNGEIEGTEYENGKVVFKGTFFKIGKRKKGTIYDGKGNILEKDVEYLKNGNRFFHDKNYEDKDEDEGIKKGFELNSKKNTVFIGKIKDGEYLEGALYDGNKIIFNGKFYEKIENGEKIKIRDGKFYKKNCLHFEGTSEVIDNGTCRPINGILHIKKDDKTYKILVINGFEINTIKSSDKKKTLYKKFSEIEPEEVKMEKDKMYFVEAQEQSGIDIILCEGQFFNGKFHGKGKTYSRFFDENEYNNGLFKDFKKKEEDLEYEGYFFMNLRSGFGKKYGEDITYEGEFRTGKKHGEGCLFDKTTKTKLIGEFINDKPHEVKEYHDGKLVFNGIYYKYNYINNKRWEGEGVEYKKSGKKQEIIFSGDYKNGLRWNGEGKEYDEQGNLVFEGKYERGLRYGAINGVKIKNMPAGLNLNTATSEKIKKYQ